MVVLEKPNRSPFTFTFTIHYIYIHIYFTFTCAAGTHLHHPDIGQGRGEGQQSLVKDGLDDDHCRLDADLLAVAGTS